LTELHYHEFADAISVWSIAAFLYEYDSATACGARQHGSPSHCAAKGIVPIARARQERQTIGSPIAADKCSKIKAQIDKVALPKWPPWLCVSATGLCDWRWPPAFRGLALTRISDIKLNQQA
jgi:hypothetical protein